MAVSVVSSSEDLLVRGLLRRDIPRRKIGLDEARKQFSYGLRSRIKALVGLWEELRDSNSVEDAPSSIVVGKQSHGGLHNGDQDPVETQLETIQNGCGLRGCQSESKFRIGNEVADLFRPHSDVRPDAVPPPTYEDSLQDLPPDYTSTDALATSYFLTHEIEKSNYYVLDQKLHFWVPETHEKVDLTEIEGIRSYANKKAKKAAKAAQQAKWADSDNEENGNAEGGDGEGGGDGGDGGDGGAGAGGDGGDPPGGGDGGDDDDWWNTGMFELKLP